MRSTNQKNARYEMKYDAERRCHVVARRNIDERIDTFSYTQA